MMVQGTRGSGPPEEATMVVVTTTAKNRIAAGIVGVGLMVDSDAAVNSIRTVSIGA